MHFCKINFCSCHRLRNCFYNENFQIYGTIKKYILIAIQSVHAQFTYRPFLPPQVQQTFNCSTKPSRVLSSSELSLFLRLLYIKHPPFPVYGLPSYGHPYPYSIMSGYSYSQQDRLRRSTTALNQKLLIRVNQRWKMRSLVSQMIYQRIWSSSYQQHLQSL